MDIKTKILILNLNYIYKYISTLYILRQTVECKDEVLTRIVINHKTICVDKTKNLVTEINKLS